MIVNSNVPVAATERPGRKNFATILSLFNRLYSWFVFLIRTTLDSNSDRQTEEDYDEPHKKIHYLAMPIFEYLTKFSCNSE